MREGVGRRGEQLYPAFPYDHYTHISDADTDALYAYLMTRIPVRAADRANDLAFPLQFRPLLAGWKLLFFEADAQSGARRRWNRGGYLVEALGHCSACHSPRNSFGAEERRSDVAFAAARPRAGMRRR